MKKNEIKYLAICLLVIIATVFWSGSVDPAVLCVEHWALYSGMMVGIPVVVIWNRDKRE